MIRFGLILLLTVFSVNAQGQSRYDDLSIDELENLPKEELDQLPVSIIIAKSGFPEEMMRTALAHSFATLYYLDMSQSNFEATSRKFQRDIGAPVTGVLTVGQMEQLQKRAETVSKSRISAGSYSSVLINNDAAVAEGTYEIVDDQIAFPTNVARIVCYRAIGTCDETQAIIQDIGGSYFLGHLNESYKVLSWTPSEIIARAGGDTDCRHLTLTLNSRTNEATVVTTNNDTSGCDIGLGGENLPALGRPRVSRLVNGYDVTGKWNDSRDQANLALFSLEYRELAKQIKSWEQEQRVQ